MITKELYIKFFSKESEVEFKIRIGEIDILVYYENEKRIPIIPKGNGKYDFSLFFNFLKEEEIIEKNSIEKIKIKIKSALAFEEELKKEMINKFELSEINFEKYKGKNMANNENNLSVSKELEILKEEIKKIIDFINENKELKENIIKIKENLENKLMSEQKEKTEINNKLNECINENKNLKEKKEDLENKLMSEQKEKTEINNKLNECINENKNLKEKKEDLENKLKATQNEKTEINNKLNECINENKNLKEKKEDLENKLKATQNEKTEINNKLNECINENKNLEEIKEDLENKLMAEQKEKTEINNKLNECINENKNLEEIKEDLENKLKDAQNEKTEINNKLNECINENKNLKEIKKDLEIQLINLKNEKDELYKNYGFLDYIEKNKMELKYFEDRLNKIGLDINSKAFDIALKISKDYMYFDSFLNTHIEKDGVDKFKPLINIINKVLENDKNFEKVICKAGDEYDAFSQMYFFGKKGSNTISEVIINGWKLNNTLYKAKVILG